MGRTPPRLSFIDGQVSFWRPGNQDWQPAFLNIALAPGDLLYTGADANLELQVGGQRDTVGFGLHPDREHDQIVCGRVAVVALVVLILAQGVLLLTCG